MNKQKRTFISLIIIKKVPTLGTWQEEINEIMDFRVANEELHLQLWWIW